MTGREGAGGTADEAGQTAHDALLREAAQAISDHVRGESTGRKGGARIVVRKSDLEALRVALAAKPPEPTWPGSHREPNHYDWFMPDDPTAAVDEYLDDLEAKLTDALSDFYVHDMAQAVLPLIAAYRALRDVR